MLAASPPSPPSQNRSPGTFALVKVRTLARTVCTVKAVLDKKYQIMKYISGNVFPFLFLLCYVIIFIFLLRSFFLFFYRTMLFILSYDIKHSSEKIYKINI
jgi:hypothetical protein